MQEVIQIFAEKSLRRKLSSGFRNNFRVDVIVDGLSLRRNVPKVPAENNE